jgi:pSer/pThr/pTyr-binding forkhead associated (FHA) protein
MLVCRICGWENPVTAAFCTNCGAGLSRARTSADDNSPFKALSSPPVKVAPPDDDDDSDLVMPKLSAPAEPRRESAPTVLDFRVPGAGDEGFPSDPTAGDEDDDEAEDEIVETTADASESEDGAPEANAETADEDADDEGSDDDDDDDEAPEADAETSDDESDGSSDGSASDDSSSDGSSSDDDASDDDAQPADSEADDVPPDTLAGSPLDLGAVARALRAEVGVPTPVPATESGEAARALIPPGLSLETVDVDPDDDADDGFDGLRDDDDDDELVDAIEALSTGGDELQAGEADDEDEPEEVFDEEDVEDIELSTSDMQSLAPEPPGGSLLESGELEAVSLEEAGEARPMPPPIPEISARFVLRPLSENVARSQLVPVGAEPVTVGRTAGDVEYSSDDYLSPKHARFVAEGDALWVDDLDSLNGVWLRVRDEHTVQPGDELLFGRQVLRLEAAAARVNGEEREDGTRRIGTVAPDVRFCLVQLAADGGPLDRYHLPVDGCRIGRHIADLVFTEDNFMSGTHALLRPTDDGVQVRDLSSRNGSWVRVTSRQRLDPGDAVMLGRTVWRVSASVD